MYKYGVLSNSLLSTTVQVQGCIPQVLSTRTRTAYKYVSYRYGVQYVPVRTSTDKVNTVLYIQYKYSCTSTEYSRPLYCITFILQCVSVVAIAILIAVLEYPNSLAVADRVTLLRGTVLSNGTCTVLNTSTPCEY